MNHPFREHLEVEQGADGDWLRCTQCCHRLCAAGHDWKAAARRSLLPPTAAGPLMNILDGRYLLEKLFCPACGVLFNAEMVEEKHET